MILAWLEIVFTKVIEASLFASVLALLMFVIQFAFRRRLSPSWRFALWGLVLLRLLLPDFPSSPWSIFNAPRWIRLQPDNPQVMVKVTNGRIPGATALEPNGLSEKNQPLNFTEAPVVTALSFKLAIASGWALVAGLFLARLSLGAVWLKLRLRKRSAIPDPRILCTFEAVCREMNISRGPRIIETELVISPGLFGVCRAVLLLPLNFFAQLNPTELRHVFLHELAHWKRGDLLTNWLISVAGAIHWFNPIVWVVLRRLRLERELACDELVLKISKNDSPGLYGQTILKLIERCSADRSFAAVVGIVEGKQAVRRRIEQIKSFSGGNRKSFQVFGWLVLCFTIAVGLSNAQNPDAIQNAAPRPEPPAVEAGPVQKPVDGVENGLNLQAEYEKQLEIVEAARKRLHQLETSFEAQRNPTSSKENGAELAFQASELYSRLQGLSRAELRKVLPTLVRDRQLVELESSLNKAEQEYAALAIDKSDGHPDVQRIKRMMQTINKEIEDRMDSIMKGLELRVATEEATDKDTKRGDAKSIFELKRNLENQERLLQTISKQVASENRKESQVSREDEDLSLYTRTFKLDSELLEENLNRLIKGAAGSSLGSKLRSYFISKNLFETNTVTVSEGKKSKAMFFNDKTGVLFARSTLAELDKMETELLRLNTKAYNIEFYCKLIALPISEAQDFSEKWFEKTASSQNGTSALARLPEWPRGFTNGVTLMEAAEKVEGSQVLGAVSVFAYTLQIANMKVAAGPKIMLNSSFDPDKKLHQVRVQLTLPGQNHPSKFDLSAPIEDGETMIFAKKAILDMEKNFPVLQDLSETGKLFKSEQEKIVFFFITPRYVPNQADLDVEKQKDAK